MSLARILLESYKFSWIDCPADCFQIVSQPGHKKLKRYISLWNLMDICGILVFLLAIFLRHGDRRNSKNTARVFYLFDLFFWFMRFTHFFNLSKELGPVLTMILNMVSYSKQLIFFTLLYLMNELTLSLWKRIFFSRNPNQSPWFSFTITGL